MGLGEAVRLGVAASRQQGAKGVEDRIAILEGVEGEEHGALGPFCAEAMVLFMRFYSLIAL